ncbi:V-type ATP synthase subunit E [Clostridium sp.]|uniref:V-type ATP synthase subunit E n=1 Tax=Clostridium sp. TaxID=1506 RepID=UPI001A3B3353|nr:V-type ATP synthase subunit E family protein [Clostridium sp.]MBK5242477.1 V-type ATP synthase subunit E [Clostridium sp.]
MSKIDSLTSKIIEDANTKAEAILKEAKDTQVSMVESKIKEAETLNLRMLEKAKIEASTAKQRIISNSQLTVRNEKLVAMQTMIDKVFVAALEKLLQINESEYLEILKRYLISMDIAGDEEIILPGKYKEIVSDDYLLEINTALKTSGKIGKLVISSESRDINSGFIVLKNGIEINNTFESLVNSLRDEMEAQIVEQLFK